MRAPEHIKNKKCLGMEVLLLPCRDGICEILYAFQSWLRFS